jgi:hypothetical protein
VKPATRSKRPVQMTRQLSCLDFMQKQIRRRGWDRISFGGAQDGSWNLQWNATKERDYAKYPHKSILSNAWCWLAMPGRIGKNDRSKEGGQFVLYPSVAPCQADRAVHARSARSRIKWSHKIAVQA